MTFTIPTRTIAIGDAFKLPWNDVTLECKRLDDSRPGEYRIEVRHPMGNFNPPRVEVVETFDIEWWWARGLTPKDPICAECGLPMHDGSPGRFWPRLLSPFGWIPRHNDCHADCIGART